MAEIYVITNQLNGKIYIGQSFLNDPEYFGSGIHIKRIIKKYGKENFKKEIIEICENNKQILDIREKFWIEYYKSTDINVGYNISYGGQYGWMLGLKHTKKTKEKMSQDRLGNNNAFFGQSHTNKTKEKISDSLKKSELFQKSINNQQKLKKISDANKGRKHSIETKNKISIANKGKKRTDKEKERLIAMGQLKPALGRKHTDEAKQKIGKKHKGKIVSESTKNKIKNFNLGKILSNEHKQKIAKALCKTIEQYDLNENLINTWVSSIEASKDLNLPIKTIRYYCRKLTIKNKYGLIYKNEQNKK